MHPPRKADWDPRSDAVLRHPVASFDHMREQCPVAWSDFLGWSVFRHRDVVRILKDHATFSSAVSRFPSVPGGMDPPDHTAFRALIEPCFSAPRLQALEAVCGDTARTLVSEARSQSPLDFIAAVATPFAVRAQCAFLGWPAAVEEQLADWTRRNHAATLAQDRSAMAAIASEFEALIAELITERQAKPRQYRDLTQFLLQQKVHGRPISRAELVSIFRTWTVGEIGSIAASIGILARHLAHDKELQNHLRKAPDRIPEAIDEILRIQGPLVTSRRKAGRDVQLGGRHIRAGERISINWIAANRDPRVFEQPEQFRFGRNGEDNLLYGKGIHACPGAGLARMEMRVFLSALLKTTTQIAPDAQHPTTPASYPVCGYATLPLQLG